MKAIWKKLTFFIDRKPTYVPFMKRLAAYVIDWGLAGIVAGFPAVFMYAYVTGNSDMFSNLYVFPALGYSTLYAYLAAVLCLVVAMIYFVYIPFKKYPGQTIGKKWMKIKIIKRDLTPLDLKTLMIRQVLGLIVLENVAVVISAYLRQALTLASGVYMDYILTAVGSFVAMISAMLVFNTDSKRSIHDYLAGTLVVGIDERYVIEKKKADKKRKRR